ncbi:serine hydrolase [Xanthobacter sp. V4C-4]|uniref:serine hydrolase n=1 Tax=Xanthobacter cornucopiae TaxID=3119924 RepID=UPI00372C2E60
MAMGIDRRAFLGWGGAAAAALMAPTALSTEAIAATDRRAITQALQGFDKLPGTVAYMIRVGKPGRQAWETSRNATTQMFVGSAVKTFILTRFLKDVEDGRLNESQQLAVNDAVRTLDSSVFLELTGKTPGTSVLEAMISHSDNTATDIAISQVGIERVRAFIASAGLTSVQVPASTRRLISYLAGAPYGVDVGWEGAQRIAKGQLFGPVRPAMNTRESMKASAADFVQYYERLLGGAFLRTPEMQTEFRRISSMGDALWKVVPQNTAAYGKGGSIEWNNFNCFCLPGQMQVAAATPVTFAFCINWNGAPSTIPAVRDRFAATIQSVLAQVAQTFG